jgi:hypothetical protein
MRGFEDSTNPVLISVDDFGLGTGPFAIDGARAEATTYGVLCNVGNDRYFIPWQHVRAIKQTQVPGQTPVAPIITQVKP